VTKVCVYFQLKNLNLTKTGPFAELSILSFRILEIKNQKLKAFTGISGNIQGEMTKMPAITLLDGGLGQEIYKRSNQPAHPLWSVQVMRETPEHVQAAHEDFIRAGARIITLNTYTATPTRLARDGKPEWLVPVQQKAMEIAHNAVKATGKPVQVAGCLPPLVGSYSNDSRSEAELLEEYRKIVEVEKDGVDLFIAETQSNAKEARAATKAASESGKKVLLSFTLSDDGSNTLRSGETLEAAIATLNPKHYDALLFNCSFPEVIGKAMSVAGKTGKPFGGYANGFTSVEPLKPGGTVDSLTARDDLNEQRYAELVMDWVKQGATIVGGCCEVGPAHIAILHNTLVKEGYEVKGQ
jgi:homocysteine S-methyltransferase